MTETETKDAIRGFLLEDCLSGEPSDSLQEDTPLRTSGLMDSISTLRLVSFLEGHFGIELEAHETGVEYFDTIGDIATLVAGKRAA